MESPSSHFRDTSVVVVTLDSSEVYIAVSLSSRSDTQVIYVDPTTGALRYTGKLGYDVFSSQNEALDYITNGSKLLCKSIAYARAILGYAALGSFGLLLIATRLTPSIPNLPGGGCICTVTESQWIKISLQNPQPQGKGETKNAQELTELDIDGKHYFCETRDITRPFPSRMPLQHPDDELFGMDGFQRLSKTLVCRSIVSFFCRFWFIHGFCKMSNFWKFRSARRNSCSHCSEKQAASWCSILGKGLKFMFQYRIFVLEKMW